MYKSRKNPRIQIFAYENYRVWIRKKNQNDPEWTPFYLVNISEEGASLQAVQESSIFEVADSLEGYLQEKNGNLLLEFTGYVVWKNNNQLGIRFHKEIIVPEQIIAVEMSLSDTI